MGRKIPLHNLIRAQEEAKKLRLASFPQQNPNPVMELDAAGHLEFANPAALETARKLGLKNVSGFLPKDIKKIIKHLVSKKIRQAYREVNIKNTNFSANIHWAPAFKTARIFFADITNRKRTEDKLKKINEELEEKVKERTEEISRYNRSLAMLSACNTALVYARKEKKLLEEICRIIVKVGGYRMAWIGSVEKNQEKSVRPIAEMGFEKGYLESANISWSKKTVKGRGPTGTAIRTGKVFIGQDFVKNKNLAPWKERALERGYRSSIALPLKNKNEVFGVLNIYAAQPNAFNEKEVELLEELAGDLAFGMTTLRAEEHHKETEDLVLASNELLRLSNQFTSRQEYLDRVVQHIKKWSACSFVGIRILQKEEFIPRESYVGFSRDFWQSENMLSLKKDQCACIRVIAGKPDPQDRSAMTKSGSFYTNDSAGFIAELSEKEQARFRGKCIRCGFDSIAIIPIRRRETVLGAIHIADKKPGLLPLKKIEMLESMAVLIGEAINKFNAQKRLIESYKHLGFINRKIPVLLELDRHSKKGSKKEVAQYVLNSAVNISGSGLGLLYRCEEGNKFNLVSHLGIPHNEAQKIKVVKNKTCRFLNYSIRGKSHAQDLPKEVFQKCFNITAASERFFILPLWKKMDKKLKGFMLLGSKNSEGMGSDELDFYDVFSVHASAALLSAEVLK